MPIATIRTDLFDIDCESHAALKSAIRTLNADAQQITNEAAPISVKLWDELQPRLTPLTNHVPTQCAGINCTSTDGTNHSPECIAEHERVSGQSIRPIDPEAMTLRQQVLALTEAYKSLRMWNMDASGVTKMLHRHGVEIFEPGDKFPGSDDVAEKITFYVPPGEPSDHSAFQYPVPQPIFVEPVPEAQLNDPRHPANRAHVASSDEAWANGWAAQAWQEATTSSRVFDVHLAKAVGRVILKLIEDPQALERSELYRSRMAGISTAAKGYCPSLDRVAGDYITPALRDVKELYNDYDRAYQVLYAAGYHKNEHGAIPPVLKKWMDEYVVSAKARAQAIEIEKLSQSQIIPQTVGVQLGGAGGQFPGAAGQPGRHVAYNPLMQS